VSEFAVRQGVADDYRLVFNATARALRFSPPYVDLPQERYTDAMNSIVARMLASWTLYVAVFVNVPDEIAGFLLCVPGKALGSIFVKKDYRQRGVAKMLMEAGSLREFVSVFYRPQPFNLAITKGFKPRFCPYYVGT
jgi:GNAT superfamily N-acetyltransferase